MEGRRKRERPLERWTDELEKCLKVTGIRNWPIFATDWKELRSTLLEAKVHNEKQCFSIRGR